VEKAVSDLVIEGNIKPFELAILNYVTTNKSYTELEDLLGISRNTIAQYFKGICDRISFYLGSEFTDEGYLAYMKSKYKLTEKQTQQMRAHINSRYRHAVRRTPHE
jgi:DNA-binding CsgD family transcriptional regulator